MTYLKDLFAKCFDQLNFYFIFIKSTNNSKSFKQTLDKFQSNQVQ